MNLKVAAALAALTVAWSSQARDLKADLQALAPAGKTIRLVYQKGGPPGDFNGLGNDHINYPNTALYAVSSDDGIIRKIYPGGDSTGDYHCVNITNDGSRVVFYDFGRSQIVVTKYDGTFVRRIASSSMMYDYWIDPQAKTEWAVVSNDQTLSRINIDNPTSATVTMTTYLQSNHALLSDGLGGEVTDDGSRVVIVNENTGAIGLVTCATGAFAAGTPGCWPMTVPGSANQFSQNVAINSTLCTAKHHGPTVYSSTGAVVKAYCTTDTIAKWMSKNMSYDLTNSSCYGEDGYSSEGTRWTRDGGYVTFYCERTKISPIIYRLADGKWTYIEDALNCTFAGDMDGQVGTFATEVAPTPGIQPMSAQRQAREARAYSLDGRLLAQSARNVQAHKGIVISQSATGTVTRVYK